LTLDPEPSSLTLFFLSANTALVSGILLLAILLLCSALISGAEVAFFSLTRTDIDNGLEENPKAFQIISKLLERPKKLLATILVANNFANIGIVILFAYLGEFLFYKIDIFWVRFIFEVVIVTFLILLIGEIIPKIYASRNRLKFAVIMAIPIKVIDVLFSPLSLPMRHFTLFIHKKLGKQKTNISVDQLSHALELTSKTDTTKEEHKILQGIVSFGNTDTKQVMRPRIDIFALSTDQKYSEIIPEIIKNGYSRIPVYKDSIDTVIGMLDVKDLLPYSVRKLVEWTTLMREPL